ncbi:hypothetical protein [Thalassococcus lentus]|uniref:Uncharacterized protein n=1 Tax=Thalassococcus lentus TaxID=1210524 RepID=A0ABT4XTY7_9RHOB|nr:hypothetical protein [Thalassococcus lentus]MDA7425422.1 hypothetical protein [Thalassococcus lentus]
MSRPKHSTFHLGPLGTFYSGSGLDVDCVHLPATVISRAAGLRVECTNEDDLRAALIAHWEASGRMFSVDDVLEWALDRSPPMTGSEVTSGLRQVGVNDGWLQF